MTAPALFGVVLLLLTGAAQQGARNHYPLDSAKGLALEHVTAEPVTHEGRKGLRITTSPDTLRQLPQMTPEVRAKLKLRARIEGAVFSNGTIEAEIAGAPEASAGEGARGFVGIAFRLKEDGSGHDEFYLRPTNGRAEDQERRNHAVQYESLPDWPWFRLRKETPSKYEAYADLVPGQWTKVKIEVRGEKARLYIHGHEQPTLIVNDVKSGANAKGGVALTLGVGTVAHFRNLTITPAPEDSGPVSR